MSRRRGDGDGVGSLEMLLDTMCNTFGSLIFMAVLLAVINQHVSEKMTADTREGITRAEAERQEARIAELQSARAGLQQTLQQLADLADRATHIAPQDLSESVRRYRSTVTESEQRLQQLQGELDAARREEEALKQSQADTRRQIEKASDQAGAAVQRTFTVPSLHDVNRELKLTCALQAGRLYLVHDPERSWHNDDVEVADSGGVFTVRLKPAGGVPVRAEGLQQTVATALGVVPNRALVMLHVAPDSFAEFQLVKRAVVDLGFEYNWVPWEGPLTFRTGQDRLRGQ